MKRPEVHDLTDRDLALVLAVSDPSDYVHAYALNEACARLDLPLDETEQGLTARAANRVERWIELQLAPSAVPA